MSERATARLGPSRKLITLPSDNRTGLRWFGRTRCRQALRPREAEGPGHQRSGIRIREIHSRRTLPVISRPIKPRALVSLSRARPLAPPWTWEMPRTPSAVIRRHRPRGRRHRGAQEWIRHKDGVACTTRTSKADATRWENEGQRRDRGSVWLIFTTLSTPRSTLLRSTDRDRPSSCCTGSRPPG